MPLTPEQVERIAVSAATRAATQAVENAADRAAEKVAMSRAELNSVVAEAVKQTLIQLGVDTSDPLAMQRDFQHLRQWREAGEDLKRKGTLALLGIFLSGLVTLLLLGLKEWFQK
jgi:SpoVK/Ycf46/Vps4 family AAA+-type ATPase